MHATTTPSWQRPRPPLPPSGLARTVRDRGDHWVIFDNADGTFTYRTGDVQLWAYDDRQDAYRPFVDRVLADGARELRNGRAGLRVTDDGVAIVDGKSGRETHVGEEIWTLVRDGSPVAAVLTASTVETRPEGPVLTRVFETPAGEMRVEYALRQGQAIKQTVTLAAQAGGEFHLRQSWIGVAFDATEMGRPDEIQLHLGGRTSSGGRG